MAGQDNQTGEDSIQVHTLTKLYAILLLNSQGSITGYRILKQLEENLGKRASPTYIYDFLKELKEAGYIEEIETETSKRAKGFRITASGKIFADRIISRFDGLISVAIRPKLTICAHCGVQLYDDYHVEEINGKQMNFCCKHCAGAYKQHVHGK
ncbi:MAG: helix-turn-helix transcriptional regulator [Candidatus Odinarchaeota archaeon]